MRFFIFTVVLVISSASVSVFMHVRNVTAAEAGRTPTVAQIAR